MYIGYLGMLKLSIEKPYWKAVARCIRSVTSISISMSIGVCLLHLMEPLATTRAIQTLITLLLYYTKKRLILFVEVLFDSNFGVLEGISQ